jgi:hypothetical protein
MFQAACPAQANHGLTSGEAGTDSTLHENPSLLFSSPCGAGYTKHLRLQSNLKTAFHRRTFSRNPNLFLDQTEYFTVITRKAAAAAYELN